jgi:hypothetical protein
MGKASSTKKVARVARTGGGRTARGRGSLLWPSMLTLAVIVGTVLIFYSRAENQTSIDNIPPQPGDHWHTAYGFFICDHFLPPIADQSDPLGIHTHGEGVVHIHPAAAAASGAKATFGVFMDAVGGKVSRSEIKVPGQKTWKNGMKCGSKEGRVEARAWSEQRASATGRPVREDPADYRMHDRDQLVIAFVPEGTAIPRPPSAPNLDQLSDVPSSSAPGATTTVPGATTTTAPGTPPTTAPNTATTAPGATTTTAAGP